jgi:antitoxin component YwqK of YwqJK toxin-antitoxin module
VATWRRGRGEGLWTYFHDTGAIRERSAVVDDVFHGPVEGWHPSGVKAFEGHYRRGEKDGRWRRWDSAGRLAKIEVFRDGTLLHSETL